MEHNIPIDTRYYLENQLSKPLMRIFEPILGTRASSLRTSPKLTLVSGEHTRVLQVATSNVGALMKFAVKKVLCLGCRTPLKDQNAAVCPNCKSKEMDIYFEKLARVPNLLQAQASTDGCGRHKPCNPALRYWLVMFYIVTYASSSPCEHESAQ